MRVSNYRYSHNKKATISHHFLRWPLILVLQAQKHPACDVPLPMILPVLCALPVVDSFSAPIISFKTSRDFFVQGSRGKGYVKMDVRLGGLGPDYETVKEKVRGVAFVNIFFFRCARPAELHK